MKRFLQIEWIETLKNEFADEYITAKGQSYT